MTTAFTVLGMHKSGTTLVSQMLNASGIRMVEAEDVRSYDEGNHFERQATSALNKELLQCGSTNSLRVTAPYRPSADHPAAIAKARGIAQDNTATGDWGFKDPRSCLTHAFWFEALPDLRVICVFRGASSVRRHYTVGKPHAVDRGLRALRAWHIYNAAMLEAYESTAPDRRILLEYETLMREIDELKRIEAFVGRPIHDSRTPALNRRESKIGKYESVERALLQLTAGLDVTALEARLATAFAAERPDPT